MVLEIWDVARRKLSGPDIEISGEVIENPTLPPVTLPSTSSSTQPPTPSVSASTSEPVTISSTSSPVGSTHLHLSCVSIGAYAGDAFVAKWCFEICNYDPAFCPGDRCECVETEVSEPVHCRAAGPWSGDELMDAWCETNCNSSPPFCPMDMCQC